MAKKATPKTYKGKSTAPGGGGKFQMMKDAIMKTGKNADAAAAIAAAQGRKKYGKEKFQSMAATGRKRSERKK